MRAHASGSRPSWQKFHSEPLFHPTFVHVGHDGSPGSGDFFLTPVKTGQLGPMIVNGHGQLIWFRHTGRLTAFNFEAQRLDGKRVLTWWQGRVVNGHGADGHDVILDNAYRTLAVLHGGYGYSSDLHEFQISPSGTALIDAFVPVHTDLTSVGGPRNGTVLDCVIQELNIRTGHVLWEWHALGHIPLTASYAGTPSGSGPYDYFHINSIQALPDGRLIISARNTWSVYMIDKASGRVVWTLGGRYSNYRMGPGTNFEWQHDARLHRRGILTLFDDAGFPQEEGQSSAKKLRIDIRSGLVSLVHRYVHSPPLLAGSEGSTQLLSNGNVIVGWGSANAFSEYTAAGRQIVNGGFRIGVNSYRAYRFRWTGSPAKPPKLALVPRADGSLRAFASWNGATQVASWRLLGGGSRGQLISLRQVPQTGFETTIGVRSSPPYVEVQALDSRGDVLGHSSVKAVRRHFAVYGRFVFVSTSNGVGGIPVGCFAGRGCRLNIRISSRGSVLARARKSLSGYTGALVYFAISRRQVARLEHARGHQLPIQVTVRDSRGVRAGRRLSLVPFTISGPGPARSSSDSPRLQLVGESEFISSRGGGGILAACFASVPCHVRSTISARGRVIARTGSEILGADELGYLPFRLRPAGQSMLSGAPGNQLAADVQVVGDAGSAHGQVVLIRYG